VNRQLPALKALAVNLIENAATGTECGAISEIAQPFPLRALLHLFGGRWPPR
jgi:cytochrome P450